MPKCRCGRRISWKDWLTIEECDYCIKLRTEKEQEEQKKLEKKYSKCQHEWQLIKSRVKIHPTPTNSTRWEDVYKFCIKCNKQEYLGEI